MGGRVEGTTGPLPSAEGRRGHLAEGSSLQFTGFCILPAPGQESAYGWGTRNSLISTRHQTSFNTRGFRGDSARPLGCKAISVYMHCTLTHLSWKFQRGASLGSLGNFLIQIPFDSNSESVSWQGPSLPSSLCSEVRNGGRRGQGAPEVSFGDRCCRRPLLCARLLITGHTGALARGLSRQGHTSGSILELSLCGPHLSSVSLSSKRK